MAYTRFFLPFENESIGYGFKGRTPAGRCIVESRDGQGKLSVTAQDIKTQTRYGVYLIFADSGRYAGVFMGSLNADEKGKAELRKDIETAALGSYELDELIGVAIIVSDAPANNQVTSPLCGYRDRPVSWRGSFFEAKIGEGRKTAEKEKEKEVVVAPVEVEPEAEVAVEETAPTEVVEEEPIEEPVPEVAHEPEPEVVAEEPIEEPAPEVVPEPEPEIVAEEPVEEPEPEVVLEPEVPPEPEVVAEEPIEELEPAVVPEPEVAPEAEIPPEPAAPVRQTAPRARAVKPAPKPTPPPEPPCEPEPAPVPEPAQEEAPPEPEPVPEPSRQSAPRARKPKGAKPTPRKPVTNSPARTENILAIETLFNNKPHVTPFETFSRQASWVQLAITDAIPLPPNRPLLLEEPFVRAAYANRTHLLLGITADGTEYIIGVPSEYNPEERTHAKRLGFSKFKTNANDPAKRGDEGYWLMFLDM
ncbi:MAG: hypothetical protein FWB96_10895 [Defluviitaleaceae bacterium]|nr:hypothetical protein [Defluviitaleaceae bacterium]MCL2263460.1 hypothetical protein [Defluviitaleaceae bacterium]